MTTTDTPQGQPLDFTEQSIKALRHYIQHLHGDKPKRILIDLDDATNILAEIDRLRALVHATAGSVEDAYRTALERQP